MSSLPLPLSHPLATMLEASNLAELNVNLSPESSERTRLNELLDEPYFPGSTWLKGIRAKILFYSQGMMTYLFYSTVYLMAFDRCAKFYYPARSHVQTRSLAT